MKRVGARNVVTEERRSVRGADPGSFDAVLDRYAQAVKRADAITVSEAALRRLGLAARRVERGCDDGVQRRIELLVSRFC